MCIDALAYTQLHMNNDQDPASSLHTGWLRTGFAYIMDRDIPQ
jgi:hypothetical protein